MLHCSHLMPLKFGLQIHEPSLLQVKPLDPSLLQLQATTDKNPLYKNDKIPIFKPTQARVINKNAALTYAVRIVVKSGCTFVAQFFREIWKTSASSGSITDCACTADARAIAGLAVGKSSEISNAVIASSSTISGFA